MLFDMPSAVCDEGGPRTPRLCGLRPGFAAQHFRVTQPLIGFACPLMATHGR